MRNSSEPHRRTMDARAAYESRRAELKQQLADALADERLTS